MVRRRRVRQCPALSWSGRVAGKTRLFIEGAQRLRSQGWRAGFLHEAVEPDRFEELLAAASERPTLVVIDRAESLPSLGALLLSVAHRRKAGGPGSLPAGPPGS